VIKVNVKLDLGKCREMVEKIERLAHDFVDQRNRSTSWPKQNNLMFWLQKRFCIYMKKGIEEMFFNALILHLYLDFNYQGYSEPFSSICPKTPSLPSACQHLFLGSKVWLLASFFLLLASRLLFLKTQLPSSTPQSPSPTAGLFLCQPALACF
jgi:hypothetical protein